MSITYNVRMDEHKSPEQLAKELKEAAKIISVGGTYCHYKTPASRYTIIDIGFMESDNSLCVIYQSHVKGMPPFVRPFTEWIDTVEWEGRTVPRFRRI